MAPDFTAVFSPEEDLNAVFEGTVQVVGEQYHFGSGLKYDPATRTVSVDTADAVAVGDQRPVTSAAVQVEIGNISALLERI